MQSNRRRTIGIALGVVGVVAVVVIAVRVRGHLDEANDVTHELAWSSATSMRRRARSCSPTLAVMGSSRRTACCNVSP
jgi:hypothetical protein